MVENHLTICRECLSIHVITHLNLKSMNASVKHQHSCQLTSFKSLSVAQGKVMQTFKLKSGSTSIFIHGSNRHCLLKRYVLSSWRSLSWFVNINCHPNKQHKKSNTDPYCQIWNLIIYSKMSHVTWVKIESPKTRCQLLLGGFPTSHTTKRLGDWLQTSPFQVTTSHFFSVSFTCTVCW